MNKKTLIIFIVIGIVVLSGVIGIFTYTNRPEYVIKQYVECINNGKFDKLKKYEYNYGKYRICSSIDTYIDEGMPIDKIQDKAYISEYKLYETPMSIQQWTGDLYITLMDFNVGDNYKKISQIIVYEITPGFSSLEQKYGGFHNIVLGKVGLKWKVVYSPYYYLK